MNVTAIRLSASARDALKAHLLALPAQDRRLRFGSSLSSDGVCAYIDGIDFGTDEVFAVHDDRLALVGVAHLAFGEEFAELGLSILPSHRRQGIGSALFARAAVCARNRSISRLYMHCLQENEPVMRIARKAGMEVVTSESEADAHLELPPASAASMASEFVSDTFALCDHARRMQTAVWSGVGSLLLGGTPEPHSGYN